MAEYQYDPCNYCAFGDACPSAHFWPFGYHKCADMKDMREQPKEVLTMAEYISRQKALEEMHKWCDPCGSGIEAILAVPTADAVPVVRCKECNWAGGDFVCYRGVMVQHKPEDFCSYGERRGGGEDD